MIDPYAGRKENGIVYGRGACDAKGQVATIFLTLKVLEALEVQLAGNVITHLVVEEENGGNGTLAMARRGERADGCIVMEPSDGRLFTSIRGAVWFRLVLKGKAGHSGQAAVTRSALLMARDAIGVLERYHADLLAESRGFELFDVYPNPMPITFGRLHAGNWPASAPSEAVLEGVLGLLPNKTKEQVCQEMRQTLIEGGGESLADNFELTFMYRHDSSVVDPGHALPQTILRAAGVAGTELEIAAMTASCDAWWYNNQLDIPTVVYGPGSLSVAHSKDEHVKMSDIAEAAEVLTHTILAYCGPRI
jgi:acetylornithine deacetylase